MRILIAALCGLSSQPAWALALLLATGANQSFDPALPNLAFAVNDAAQFAAAMRSVGMSDGDATVVKSNPTRAEFASALDGVAKLFAAAKDPEAQKFFFYFSGHSDEHGLHLRDGLYTKEELHGTLARIAARTKVVVLDSCFSGAIARKGVREVDTTPPLKLTLDEPSGSVFLTATSARDVAVESQAMRGSLFTRHLVAGMYGQADGNGDGVVTATELYEYAFRETQITSYLLPTATPQKPELISELQGRGAVSITYPQGRTGRLRLLADLGGTVSIQAAGGVTSLEVAKPHSQPVEVPLPSGPYRVWIRDGGRIGQAEVDVGLGTKVALASKDVAWRDAALPATATVKGATPAAARPLGVALFVGADPTVDGSALALDATVSRADATEGGLAVSLGGARAVIVEGDGTVEERRGSVRLGYVLPLLDRARNGAGLALDLGLGFGVSRVEGRGVASWGAYDLETRVAQYPVARLGARLALLTDRVWLGAACEANVEELTRREEARGAGPRAWGALGLGTTL